MNSNGRLVRTSVKKVSSVNRSDVVDLDKIGITSDSDYDDYVISCPRGCGKTYKYKSSVRNHLRECGLEPQFICCICKRRFTQKGNLKAHLLKIHSDITM